MTIRAARCAMLALALAMSAVSASARPTHMPITGRPGSVATRIHRFNVGPTWRRQSMHVPSRDQDPFADLLLG